jgi:late competence protein required for DNA uptake (superfamily II DNA/RNA helicase)
MQKDFCGYCGKENRGKFAKCWECHDKLEKADIQSPCFYCHAGVIMVREGKFGKFKTCSNWAGHPGGQVAWKGVKLPKKKVHQFGKFE